PSLAKAVRLRVRLPIVGGGDAFAESLAVLGRGTRSLKVVPHPIRPGILRDVQVLIHTLQHAKVVTGRLPSGIRTVVGDLGRAIDVCLRWVGSVEAAELAVCEPPKFFGDLDDLVVCEHLPVLSLSFPRRSWAGGLDRTIFDSLCCPSRMGLEARDRLAVLLLFR